MSTEPREWSQLPDAEKLEIANRLLGESRYPFFTDWEAAHDSRPKQPVVSPDAPEVESMLVVSWKKDGTDARFERCIGCFIQERNGRVFAYCPKGPFEAWAYLRDETEEAWGDGL